MATVNAAEVFNQLHSRWIEAAIVTSRDQKRPAYNPIAQKFTIPAAQTAAGSITRLWKFPSGAYLLNWRSTPSDMDTNVSPVITYSIVCTDDADAVQLTIVSGSTNAQAAAGSDSMIAAVMGRYVGNQWLSFKVGTGAATGVAGTLKVFCPFALGVINRSARGLYLKDSEA
jgi:hypothetical protein